MGCVQLCTPPARDFSLSARGARLRHPGLSAKAGPPAGSTRGCPRRGRPPPTCRGRHEVSRSGRERSCASRRSPHRSPTWTLPQTPKHPNRYMNAIWNLLEDARLRYLPDTEPGDIRCAARHSSSSCAPCAAGTRHAGAALLAQSPSRSSRRLCLPGAGFSSGGVRCVVRSRSDGREK